MNFRLEKTSVYSIRNEKDLCQDCAKTCSLLSKSCEENNVALTGKLWKKGMRFWRGSSQDVAMITAESTTLLKGLKEDDFQGCFNQWKRRWEKCIVFEGDKNDVLDNT
jgi:hypothetical protein